MLRTYYDDTQGTETNVDFDTLKTRQGKGVVCLRYHPMDSYKSPEIPSINFLRYQGYKTLE
jgi:hypothetical protein